LENNRQTVIGFNHYLYSSGGKGVAIDPRVNVSIIPIGDGMSIAIEL
jgi:hypothetical protein